MSLRVEPAVFSGTELVDGAGRGVVRVVRKEALERSHHPLILKHIGGLLLASVVTLIMARVNLSLHMQLLPRHPSSAPDDRRY